jgi:hypothetical protein
MMDAEKENKITTLNAAMKQLIEVQDRINVLLRIVTTAENDLVDLRKQEVKLRIFILENPIMDNGKDE